jgi:tetratricopeptide (TPR) repeat protein
VGSPGRALALYEKVAEWKADYGGVHRKIAAIWIQRKQPEKALPELELALKSSPGNPELLEQIGDLEEGLGNHEAALAAWQQAGQSATGASVRKRLSKRRSASPPLSSPKIRLGRPVQ